MLPGCGYLLVRVHYVRVRSGESLADLLAGELLLGRLRRRKEKSQNSRQGRQK